MSDLHRPNKIHKTLIWGGWYGSRNIGDTAILLGIKELYRRINQGKHYYLRFLSTDVDYTSTNGVSGSQALVKSDIYKPWNWGKIFRVFRKADRVIISGGTPIFDYSHKIRTLYFYLPLLFGKPFILFGAGVKPITSKYGRWYIPHVLKKAYYISARDNGSTQILKDMGLERTVKTADSAFFAKSSERPDLEEVLNRYNISWDEKLLVVAPRLLSPDKKRLYLDQDMDSNVIEETPKKIAEVIDRMSDRFDRVVIMAMHYYGPDSDVPLIKEIISLVKSTNTTFLQEELRPEVGIGLFKHAHIVLGMRLHSLLLSSSMYTPIVGIAYEQKVKDLFVRLGVEEYVVDMFDFSSDQLYDMIVEALKSRDALHAHLENRVGELRGLVLKDASNVLKIENVYSEE